MRSIDELPGPRRLPVVGNSLQMKPSQAHLVAEGWCARYGPLFRFDLGPRPVVGVGTLEDINTILRDRPTGFSRWAEVEPVFRELGVAGVFSAEGEDWHRQRRLAVTALNSNHLHRYFFVIHRAAERLNERLAASAAAARRVDLQAPVKSFTTDVISALAFGQDLVGDHQADQLRADIDRLFTMMGRRFLMPVAYWRHVKLPPDRALDQALQRLRAVVADFIAAARDRIRRRPELREKPENFLESMLAAQEVEGRFSEQELFANTLTMLVAGEDTTSATLGWTAWYLSRNPDVQQRLAAEADELMGRAVIFPDHEHVNRFEYGEAVIREVMRLRPAAPMQTAQALKDTQIADLNVPTGTKLALFARYAAANEEALFPDPGQFRPERWLDANGSSAQQRKAMLTFGAGPRFCPGRNLALLEAKTALATLVRNYRLEPDPAGRPVNEKFTFTVVPDAVNVVLRPRLMTPTGSWTSKVSAR